jgi:hypothetical protein
MSCEKPVSTLDGTVMTILMVVTFYGLLKLVRCGLQVYIQC